MAILGPFKVNYPVAFRSGGDTTRVAFGKHIQEIERIYGILNALDADKLSASDLDGKLSNANIDAGNVNGLQALVKSLIPESKGNGDGITDFDIDENHGYAVFANGLILQWGKENCTGNDSSAYALQQVSFPKSFPNACSNIFLTVSTKGIAMMDGSYSQDSNLVTVKSIDELTTNSGFTCGWNIQMQSKTGSQFTERLRLRYLAIGY